MAVVNRDLRQQCHDLLGQLKLQQSELKVLLPHSKLTNNASINFHYEISEKLPKSHYVLKLSEPKPTVFRKNENSSYARDKLKSVPHHPHTLSWTNHNAVTEPIYKTVSTSIKTVLNNKSRTTDKVHHIDNKELYRPPSQYTTDDNMTNNQPSNSSRYTASLRTRRRREIIDRNVHVDRDDAIFDYDETDRLNFSYTNVNNDDEMTSLKTDVYTSAQDDMLGIAHQRTNNTWRSKRVQEDVIEAVDSEITYAKQLQDEGNDKQHAAFVKEVTTRPNSILTNNNSTTFFRNSKDGTSKVSFFASESGDTSSVLRRDSERKLLGYDWIAALLDNDKNVIDESEAYFEDLKEFRRINRDECSNQVYMEGPFTLTELEEPVVVNAISETKVHPYLVNDRLFTVPFKKNLLGDELHESRSEENKKQPTLEEPRFVRVSIPRSTLETPYKFKAHRRRSFDPTDSCGLREHCLMGWENSRPAMLPSASNVGISDATGGISTKCTTTLAEAERLAKSYAWDPPPASTHRPDIFPSWRRNYQNSVLNMSNLNTTRNNTLPGDSESLRQSTSELLNSTYSMMYEMERIKQERKLESNP